MQTDQDVGDTHKRHSIFEDTFKANGAKARKVDGDGDARDGSCHNCAADRCWLMPHSDYPAGMEFCNLCHHVAELVKDSSSYGRLGSNQRAKISKQLVPTALLSRRAFGGELQAYHKEWKAYNDQRAAADPVGPATYVGRTTAPANAVSRGMETGVGMAVRSQAE